MNPTEKKLMNMITSFQKTKNNTKLSPLEEENKKLKKDLIDMNIFSLSLMEEKDFIKLKLSTFMSNNEIEKLIKDFKEN